MATYTTRFNLTKPATTETADIAVINTNMDTIDGAIPAVVDNLTSTSTTSALSANQGKVLQDGKAPLRPTTSTQTDSFTLALSDANTRILANKATAMTITIPLEAAVAFTVGDTIEVVQYGAGAVTIAITATGTLLSKDSKKITGGRYSAVSMTKLATNTWLLVGSLV